MSKFWLTVFIITGLFVGTVAYKKNCNPSGKYRKQGLTMDSSGLKYEFLKSAPASAAKVQNGVIAVVHYTGWLDNNGQKGAMFDSSVKRGKPFEFKLGAGQVIKGWDEMVAKMKVGDKVLVHIPADMAYGSRGYPGVIPGNATLIFEIELLNLK